MGKIKCLTFKLDAFPYTYYLTKRERLYNEEDLAIHYMSDNAYKKFQENQEYLEEWLEKNVEFIKIKYAYELLYYLIEWGYLGD